MKLAFSTLGCPTWEWREIVAAARNWGHDGVELRALGGSLDLLGRTEFASANFADAGIEICCVDTSCAFHSTDPNERANQVKIALAHADLAARLATPLIRVFPDKIQSGAQREETRDWIVEGLREIAQRLPNDVNVGLETHGDFARADYAAEIVRIADHPRIKLIWDVANSVAAGDTIKHAARVVQPYLAHVHLRDAKPVAGSEHWLPVLAGTGRVSFAEAINAIGELNYEGFVSSEWEKYWHPEIENPEVAMPDFINAIRELVGNRSDTTECSRVGK